MSEITDDKIFKNMDSGRKLFEYSFSQTLKRLEKSPNHPEMFKWIYKDSLYDTHSDICFVYKNTLFSVIIDVLDEDGKSSITEEEVERQMSASKKYDFVACRFPLTLLDETKSHPLNKGWNLLLTADGKEVNPEMIASDEKKPMSNWALECCCINYLKEYLKLKKCQILSVHDISNSEPQLWYRDELGYESFVLVKIVDSDGNVVASYSGKDKIINKYMQNNGFEATLVVDASGEDDQICYGDDFDIELEDYIQVNKVDIDVYVKYQNILEEDAYDLLYRTLHQENISDKSTIGVFQVPGYKDLLLKINNVFVVNFHLITSDLALVPYLFDENVRNNPHFGIPLYSFENKKSAFAQRNGIYPHEIILVGAEKAGISILKKAAGESVISKYSSLYSDLNGIGSTGIYNDDNLVLDMLKMINIYSCSGIQGCEKALDMLEQGVYDIYSDSIENSQKSYFFTKNETFIKLYKEYAETYLESIKFISEMPQKAYNNAVKNILMPKNFVFDFNIPNNTFIDYDRLEFNFIDFRYEKNKIQKTKLKEQVKEFRNALLGRYNKIARQPDQILFRKKYVDRFSEYEKMINKKINRATSDV